MLVHYQPYICLTCYREIEDDSTFVYTLDSALKRMACRRCWDERVRRLNGLIFIDKMPRYRCTVVDGPVMSSKK